MIGEDKNLLFEGKLSGTFFKKEEFKPATLSATLRRISHIITFRDSLEIYIYNEEKGYYEPNGEQLLREIIKTVLRDKYKEQYARATINDITASTGTNRSDLDLPQYLIPVKNGLLDISTNPPTRTDFSDKYFITSTLPVEYNPEAKCPKFLKFLEEILPNEIERGRLQEHVGYTLYPRNIFEIAVLLIGPEDSGKSTFLRVLTRLLGEENTSNIPLQDLIMDKFALAQLYGKYAVIYADIPRITLQSSGLIKAIITGDRQSGQHKYHDRFDFTPRAKLWFSANLPPPTRDTSNPFFKRWDIFEFPNQFKLGNPNRNDFLIDEITTPEELSGILNWALEGLQRVLINRWFSGMKSIELRRETWLLGASSLYRFVNSCVEEDPNWFETKENFYGAYTKYCKNNNLPILDIKTVGGQLPRILPDVRTSYPKIGDKQVRSWKGVRIIGEKPPTLDDI